MTTVLKTGVIQADAPVFFFLIKADKKSNPSTIFA
jgi:hypothetical protein